MSPYLGAIHANIESLNGEMKLVADNIKNAADLTLPTVKSGKTRKNSHFFKDSTLKLLCDQSKSSWKMWCEAGRPNSGQLYERKIGLRRELRKRINVCAAVDERTRTRRRENMFLQKDNKRFHAPHRKKSRTSKLRVNGEVLSKRSDLLGAWADHFGKLSTSHVDSEDGLKQLANKLTNLETASLSNEECILDVPFSLEEVELAIKKLKTGKSSGPDGLCRTHQVRRRLTPFVDLGDCQLNYRT